MIRRGRRAFLASSAGTLVALPLLRSLDSKAAAEAPPQRIITVYSANGVVPDAWFPTATSETDFELPEILTPFAAHRERLLLLSGIDNAVTGIGPGGPHQRGIGSLFTGSELQEGEFVDGCGRRAGWANGISVDQAIANVIGVDTPLKSLELGVRAQEADVQARISYAGPGKPLPPLNDPQDVFERLFSNMVSSPIDPQDSDDRRASVLQGVQQQFALLNAKLGYDDRIKLQQHVELVRDIERRLTGNGNGAPAVCQTPAPPLPLDPNNENDMPAVMKNHLDLLAVALACDSTRVASIQISTGFNRIRFPWLNSLGEGHGLSHSAGGEDPRNQLVARRKWEAEQLAYLMNLLDSIPEGDGTIMDNTMLIWGSDVSRGDTHSLTNMPYLIMGTAGGRLRGGRYLQFQGRSNNDLLVAVLNAYGIATNTFGHPDFATGALEGILA